MSRTSPRFALVAVVACLPLALPVCAQDRSATAWRALTIADLEAAHDILARNHPGAAAATGDTAFQRAMATGLEAGRRRAEQVNSYEGWLATLRAFSVVFDDPHISHRPRLALDRVRWPGFVVARRGDATVIAARDTADATLPALGTRLVSCDSQPVDRLSRERLGTFRGTWDVAAQRVRNTPQLLVDDGNPFLPAFGRCVVAEGGAERTIDLRWRAITPAQLQPLLREAVPAGRAGFGVRRVDNGWWIGLESLSDRAQGVLDSTNAHLQAIREAPWVVVDVRGNGGGSSEWGRRLAALLVGEGRTAAAQGHLEAGARTDNRCGASWRVSADIEETIAGYIRDLGPRLGPRMVEQWKQELEAVRAARAAGRELAPEPRTCTASAARPADRALPASALRGRLVLVTDYVCFSSCLIMAPLFRAVGALHVGEGTDFSTRYMEVRAFPLPSGLGSFSTMQRVSFDAPARFGPFDPEVPFPGRIDDTAALEAWIRRQVERGG